jgi:hypothetical protein
MVVLMDQVSIAVCASVRLEYILEHSRLCKLSTLKEICLCTFSCIRSEQFEYKNRCCVI